MTTATPSILETVEFDQDGFMVDPNDWTPEIGEAIAQKAISNSPTVTGL